MSGARFVKISTTGRKSSTRGRKRGRNEEFHASPPSLW